MYLEFRDSENLSFSRPSDGVEGLTESVKSIIDDVRKRGDAALYDYALRFDSSRLDFLYVSDEEFEEAEKAVSPELKAAIAHAAQNIRKFHEAEMPEGENVETESGVRCWRKIVPLSRVGLCGRRRGGGLFDPSDRDRRLFSPRQRHASLPRNVS